MPCRSRQQLPAEVHGYMPMARDLQGSPRSPDPNAGRAPEARRRRVGVAAVILQITSWLPTREVIFKKHEIRKRASCFYFTFSKDQEKERKSMHPHTVLEKGGKRRQMEIEFREEHKYLMHICPVICCVVEKPHFLLSSEFFSKCCYSNLPLM